MSDTREFRIDISSTIDDLAAEGVRAMEFIVLRGRRIDSDPVPEETHEQNCMERVCQAYLYVGTTGHRYGAIPRVRASGRPRERELIHVQ